MIWTDEAAGSAVMLTHVANGRLTLERGPVDLLKVEHVMVVGHYGCGGVRVALRGERVGLADHWLGHVRDVAERHEARIRPLYHESHQLDRLCELNVVEQVVHVARTTIVEEAWRRGQPLALHGFVYGLADGILRDLGIEAAGFSTVAAVEKGRFNLKMKDVTFDLNEFKKDMDGTNAKLMGALNGR